VYFEHLPDWVEKPLRRDDELDVFHIYGIRHPRRDALRQHLLDAGVKTEVHYPIPPHHQVAMQGILSGSYPVAEVLHATELSLPISVGHSKEEVLAVCSKLADFASRGES
jgi:dTDP-4-amino-4,6-dideoxygalactose transaminase